MTFNKFRYNQAFHLVGADMFLKSLLKSQVVRDNCEKIASLGDITEVSFKQVNCSVINLSYFDFLEDLGIVGDDARIKGDYDEWVSEIQLSDKLRKAMLFEEDENYGELQQEKYQNEFIYRLFQYLVLGGSMCQYDLDVTEYLETTKVLYKDLVRVAKDDDT